ncbi:uncharacterized protein PG986_014034 [Apiospora aurea]|uniref:Uncharacterized protein n=1 Tax=Apiospora aurea TaxID=335848 RepID=A0ABR1PXB2_9PEZI
MYYYTLASVLALGCLPVALLPTAAAQDLPATLAGCKDVSCPMTDGKDYTCTVTDDEFNGVGLTRIADAPQALEGLTIVKGVQVQAEGPDDDHNDEKREDRQFRSVYYLGTPADVQLQDLNGCAVVFQGVAPPFSVDGNRKTTQAETPRARRSGKPCKTPPVTGCAEMLENEQGLGSYSINSLSDLSPITEARNGSSDCWPVLPKTDGLAVITDFAVKGGYDSETLNQIMFGVTPVLTVFFENNQTTTSQMTCVKVIEDVETEEDDRSAAALVSYTTLVAVTTLVAMLWSL